MYEQKKIIGTLVQLWRKNAWFQASGQQCIITTVLLDQLIEKLFFWAYQSLHAKPQQHQSDLKWLPKADPGTADFNEENVRVRNEIHKIEVFIWTVSGLADPEISIAKLLLPGSGFFACAFYFSFMVPIIPQLTKVLYIPSTRYFWYNKVVKFWIF